METEVKIKLENLIKKAFILMIISFGGVILTIREEIMGQVDSILYSLGGFVGLTCAIFGAITIFYVVGVKKGMSIEKEVEE